MREDDMEGAMDFINDHMDDYVQNCLKDMGAEIEKVKELLRIELHNNLELNKKLHKLSNIMIALEKRIFWCEENIKVNINGKKAKRPKSYQL